jgi:hypothetical protein
VKRRRAIDIDERGRVIGFVRAPQSELALGGAGEPQDPVRVIRDGLRDSLETAGELARELAEIMMTPIELAIQIIAKLKGLPMFLLVGYVLVEATKREHRSLRAGR